MACGCPIPPISSSGSIKDGLCRIDSNRDTLHHAIYTRSKNSEEHLRRLLQEGESINNRISDLSALSLAIGEPGEDNAGALRSLRMVQILLDGSKGKPVDPSVRNEALQRAWMKKDVAILEALYNSLFPQGQPREIPIEVAKKAKLNQLV